MDQEMLRVALVRVRHNAETLERLLREDAPQRDLVQAICDVAYACGVAQGAAALYIPRHAPPSLPEEPSPLT
jgi:hypothetical protein